MNDCAIADTVFGLPVLLASEEVFRNASGMGALKLLTGQKISACSYFLSGLAVNKIATCGDLKPVCAVCVFFFCFTLFLCVLYKNPSESIDLRWSWQHFCRDKQCTV